MTKNTKKQQQQNKYAVKCVERKKDQHKQKRKKIHSDRAAMHSMYEAMWTDSSLDCKCTNAVCLYLCRMRL